MKFKFKNNIKGNYEKTNVFIPRWYLKVIESYVNTK